MMRASGLFLLPVISGLVSAQSNYTIDPDSVSASTRDTWCSNQQASCPLICSQTTNSTDTEANSCEASDLSYTCVCSNGISPNASEYSQTIPYYECTEWGNQCVTACGSDDTCAYDCRANHPCGAQNPTRINATTSSASSTTASATSSGGQTTNSAGETIYSGLGGAAATTTGSSKQSGAAALEIGSAYGLFIAAGSMLGGFALLL